MVRRIALFVILPAAFAFERMAYYGMRSVLSLHLIRGLSATPETVGQIYGAMAVATALCMLFGGALCFLLRPSVVLTVGSLIGVLAYGLLSLGKSELGVWVGVLVLSLGQGLLKPAAFALAASELPMPHEHLRSALMVLMYGATNLSALTASSGSGMLAARSGESASFALSSGLAIVGVVLAIGAVVADYVTKRDEPEGGPSTGGVLAGAGLLLACALPYYAAMGLTGGYELEVLKSAGAPPASIGPIYAINPVAVLLTTGVLFIALVVLHLARARVSSLFGIGAGLVIFGLGSAPLLLASNAGGSAVALVSVAAAAMAIGEACAGPLLLSRALGDVPPRFTGLAAGVLLSVSFGVGWLADLIARPWPAATGVLVAVSVVLCFLIGAALLFSTPFLVRRLYSPSPSPAAPAPESEHGSAFRPPGRPR